ncbi:coiled-coil domain-containing protein 180-like isoform X2 [Dysidea avara]|uniref:coiled-coil domain-containing protein 180-like isoform X2 n=1 Tax=Dysidea avara TaxID=196820 RepID=UPI0033343CE1
MAAATAALSSLTKLSSRDENQTDVPTREERIAKFQSNVFTQAKKGGVLVMKNTMDYKDTKTLMCSSAKPQDLDQQEAALEVLSLTDCPGTSQELDGLSVTERVTARRKERHEKAIEDMKQELTFVSNELELRMTKSSEQLQNDLTSNDKILSSLFLKIESSEQLQTYSLEQLNTVWEEITGQTTVRMGYIKVLDSQLRSIEDDRIKMIEEILKSYGVMLEQIAYQLSEDVNRLISDEAQVVNLTVLSNRRKYADLHLHLMIVEVEREKEYRVKWQDKVEEWKQLMQQIAEEQFREYMNSELVCNPVEVNKLKEFLIAEQKSINRKRQELLQQISSLGPPAVNKSLVYEWHRTVTRLHNQLQEVHNKFLVQLQNCQEVINMACVSEVERHREQLVEMGACDVHMAYRLMNQSCMRLVEEHQARSSSALKSVERQLDEVLGQHQQQFQQLFQLAQGAAYVWDDHNSHLAELEQQLTEALEECRTQHNNDNQQLETKLDVVLAMMREGSTDEVLSQQLCEATKLLEQILEGYVSFHAELKEKASCHPSMVDEELMRYDGGLCQYFGVSRDPPIQQKQKGKTSKSVLDQKSRKTTLGSIRTDTRKTSVTPAESRLGRATTVAQIPVAIEMIQTSTGTVYYVCDQSVLGDKPQGSDVPVDSQTDNNPSVFLTQDEESDLSITHSVMTEHLVISDEMFYDVKKSIRKCYLEHLESWKVSLVTKVKTELCGKEEEYTTELDLRLHLHEPRLTRITQDIHNVRASELIAHRERLSRHIQGTNAEVANHKASISTLNDQLQAKYEQLLVDMNMTEERLLASTTLSELNKVEQDMKTTIDQHKSWLSHTTENYQLCLENTASDLSLANDNFRSSLKLFSNGGNYCREEVEFFDKKLDRLTTKIKSAHTTVTNEISTVLLTQQELVTRKWQEFTERYSYHEVDVKFLDKLSVQLTHTQVQIKTKVAASNSQSQQLLQMVHALNDNCYTCKHPSPDKPAVTPSDLMNSLATIFGACSKRVEYLHCSVTAHKAPSKVGFLTESSTSNASPAPISAVNITKSILEYVSTKRQFVSEPNFDANRSLVAGHSPLYSSRDSVRTSSVAASSQEDKRTSRQQSRKRKDERLIDRKNVKYGTGGGDDKSDCFLPKIRRVLRESHLSLYKTCEQYYRTKGASPSTRPDDIPDTFETCMDSLIERLHSYQLQAEEYSRECIDEFNSQLRELMTILMGLPLIILSDVTNRHTVLCNNDTGQLDKDHQQYLKSSQVQQAEHRSSLRPALGHPNNAKELSILCEQEADRHQKTLDTINDHLLAIQNKEKEHLELFVMELVSKTQSLLTSLDDCITIDDVISGGNKYGERPELEQLLRQHMKQDSDPNVSDVTGTRTTSKIGVDWPPLATGNLPFKLDRTVTAVPKSKKSTSVHGAVITSRDQLYQDYVSQYKERLRQWEGVKTDEEINEQKWSTSWNSSVEQVKLLYK